MQPKIERTIENFSLCFLENFYLVTFATVCRFVILGNHRDAWTFGAVDPNSGTAALLEVTIVLYFVHMV